MSKKKSSKDNRSKRVEQAYHLLKVTILDNSHVGEDVWAGAIWVLLMRAYHQNGFTYEEFSKEVENAKRFYKKNYDNEVDRSG